VGNRTEMVDITGTTTYEYDALNRLTTVTFPGSRTVGYAYDAADRLTSVTPPGQGAVSYGWDDNGNLTDRGSDDFAWDAEDRLTSTAVSSVTTTFAYNGDGLRTPLRLAETRRRSPGTSNGRYLKCWMTRTCATSTASAASPR
jgi:YD repeat-containing protein